MLLTNRVDLREQLTKCLESKGHAVCIPPHRTVVQAESARSHPDLVVMDMYLDHPSGNAVLKGLRDDGYKGMVIALSGPSQQARLPRTYSLGLHRVLKLPVQIAGSYDFGELETAVDTALRG